MALFAPPICSLSLGVFLFEIPRFEWVYFAGIATLTIGVPFAFLAWKQHDDYTGKFAKFGPVLFGIAMAIFGADHLIAPRVVANVVPFYMPWHLFWTYLVGFALIAAAASLASNKLARLAAACLGVMIFLFVLMIHVPGCFETHFNKTFVTLFFRDLSLSAGALAFAVGPASYGTNRRAHILVTAARIVFAATLIVFGIDQFLDPAFAPGIPRDDAKMMVTLPAWIPVHIFWTYAAGTLFVVCGIAIAIGKQARFAAMSIGVIVLLISVFVYLPLTISKGSNVNDGLNYLAIHFALAGAALFLASALPQPSPKRTSVTVTHAGGVYSEGEIQ